MCFQISVCYEGNNETTLYSKHTIHGANIDAKDVDPKRPSFKTSKGFFNVSMKTCYEKKNQRQLLQDLLQDNVTSRSCLPLCSFVYFTGLQYQ